MSDRTCSIEGCDRRSYCRSWCHPHYKRWARTGDPLGSKPRLTTVERFWAKVNTSGPVPDHAPHLGPCWIWTRAKGPDSYGRFGQGHTIYAHRFSYELLVGPIPEGLELDHLCRVPACCNPKHLEAVTHRENMLRGEAVSSKAARQTHCKRGHEFTPENTYRPPNGSRQCRACQELRRRRAVPVEGEPEEEN